MSMIWLVALLGLLMVICGIAVVLDPARLHRVLYWFVNPGNIYGMAVLRIALGAMLLLGSPYLPLPTLVYALGVALIGLGVVVPFLGRSRLAHLERRWLGLPHAVLRSWGLVMTLLGLLVIWISILGGI